MSLPPLILASASPRRLDLLRQMGCRFRVVAARTEEVQPEHLSPAEVCQLNACRKARAVGRRHPDALVLGADTLVCLGRRIFGKPSSLREAEQMLLALQGREHSVITGVCLWHQRASRQESFAEVTRVWFRRLDLAGVRAYLSRVNPLDKAGAYAIQEEGDMLVARIEGSFSNVVGLPVERLRRVLKEWPRSRPRARAPAPAVRGQPGPTPARGRRS